VDLRQKAAERAISYVQDGMALGIGTGKTTTLFIDLLGEAIQKGDIKDILAVPTSEASASRLRSCGIPITNLVDHPQLDLAIDGADEVDPDLNLLKGLGRACLREKIVESHARQFLVIVDESKLVKRLGVKCPLPVEILPFEAFSHVGWLESLGSRVEFVREGDRSLALTDNGNYLALCYFNGGFPDLYELDHKLAHRPGILEHGLFLDMASQVLVAEAGGVRILERKDER
jgi:ribose 5-phosphate isomerase A